MHSSRVKDEQRWGNTEWHNGQDLILEANNLEAHVGTLRREKAVLRRDNEILLIRAQTAERELVRIEEDEGRSRGP